MASDNIRAQSETVVSRKVIGSSFAPIRLLRKFGNSISGVFGGCIMIVIAIGLIIAAVKAVPKTSKEVEALKLQTPEEAKAQTGMVKVQAAPTIVTPTTLSFKVKSGILNQEVPQTFDQSMLYVKADYQIYEQIKETSKSTKTVTESGQDVEETSETTTVKEDWVSKNATETFATFKLGDITVDTNGISKKFDLSEATVENVVMPVTVTAAVFENPSADVGKTRVVISYVPTTDNIIVVGEISENDKIDGGETFLISNYTDSELIKKLKGEESTMRWVIRALAWIFLTFGFTAIIGPILFFTDLIPGLNKMVTCLVFIVFGTISALLILFVTLVVQYWWLVILCIGLGLVALFGFAIAMMLKKKK